jgi:hypothetical protein
MGTFYANLTVKGASQEQRALGFPIYVVSLGYNAISMGDVPPGVDLSRLVRVDSRS